MVGKKKQSVLLEGKGGKTRVEGFQNLAILTHVAALSRLHGTKGGRLGTTTNQGKGGE